jgi:hypothetical protein
MEVKNVTDMFVLIAADYDKDKLSLDPQYSHLAPIAAKAINPRNFPLMVNNKWEGIGCDYTEVAVLKKSIPSNNAGKYELPKWGDIIVNIRVFYEGVLNEVYFNFFTFDSAPYPCKVWDNMGEENGKRYVDIMPVRGGILTSFYTYLEVYHANITGIDIFNVFIPRNTYLNIIRSNPSIYTVDGVKLRY